MSKAMNLNGKRVVLRGGVPKDLRGSGTREDPYMVPGVATEYAILEKLGKTHRSQSLWHLDGRHLDELRCTDGTSVWFDVSGWLEYLRESLRKGRDKPE